MPVQSMQHLPSTSTPAGNIHPDCCTAFYVQHVHPPEKHCALVMPLMASMSTGQDLILSSSLLQQHTQSTSTVGPGIQNGPMLAYTSQLLILQHAISARSPLPNIPHSQVYSH